PASQSQQASPSKPVPASQSQQASPSKPVPASQSPASQFPKKLNYSGLPSPVSRLSNLPLGRVAEQLGYLFLQSF
ncbi:MAG: hypothetical protein ABL921_30490, partial [Pirellula sp.]